MYPSTTWISILTICSVLSGDFFASFIQSSAFSASIMISAVAVSPTVALLVISPWTVRVICSQYAFISCSVPEFVATPIMPLSPVNVFTITAVRITRMIIVIIFRYDYF